MRKTGGRSAAGATWLPARLPQRRSVMATKSCKVRGSKVASEMKRVDRRVGGKRK